MRALLPIIVVALFATGGAAQEAERVLGLDAPRVTEAPEGQPLAGEALEEKTEEVASTVRCPVCQGLSVADSPTDSAQAIKRELRELLAEGYSKDQVLGYLERSYGEFIRLEPKAEGFNLVVWLAPILGVLAGLMLVARRMRRTGAGDSGAAAESADPELDPYLEQVRRETRG